MDENKETCRWCGVPGEDYRVYDGHERVRGIRECTACEEGYIEITAGSCHVKVYRRDFEQIRAAMAIVDREREASDARKAKA